jgi:hypothetical protein
MRAWTQNRSTLLGDMCADSLLRAPAAPSARRGTWGAEGFAAVLVLGVGASSAGCAPGWTRTLDRLDGAALSVALPADERAVVVGGPLGSAGEALLLLLEGGRWRRLPIDSTATLWWAHAISAEVVWLVGERGTIGRLAGDVVTWEQAPVAQTLYGVWGVSDDDLWAVGGTPGQPGLLLHRDGGGWREVTPASGAPPGALFKVWGSAATDLYACGEGATLLHFDGTDWRMQPSGLPPSATLFTVAGRSSSDVYAVGGFGRAAVTHFDGQRWSPVSDPLLEVTGGLAGVAVRDDGSLLLVGGGGRRIEGRPGSLALAIDQVASTDLHAAAVRGSLEVAVGGNWLFPAGVARTGQLVSRGVTLPGGL